MVIFTIVWKFNLLACSNSSIGYQGYYGSNLACRYNKEVLMKALPPTLRSLVSFWQMITLGSLQNGYCSQRCQLSFGMINHNQEVEVKRKILSNLITNARCLSMVVEIDDYGTLLSFLS